MNKDKPGRLVVQARVCDQPHEHQFGKGLSRKDALAFASLPLYASFLSPRGDV